jgi:NAD(P)-dependent dehydrogenase (short-subunit alcohol dehydrogenase family)
LSAIANTAQDSCKASSAEGRLAGMRPEVVRHCAQEQAAAIASLASDDASFITGQVINCSGGQSYAAEELPHGDTA